MNGLHISFSKSQIDLTTYNNNILKNLPYQRKKKKISSASSCPDLHPSTHWCTLPHKSLDSLLELINTLEPPWACCLNPKVYFCELPFFPIWISNSWWVWVVFLDVNNLIWVLITFLSVRVQPLNESDCGSLVIGRKIGIFWLRHREGHYLTTLRKFRTMILLVWQKF